jgi:hypothetical protein
MENELPVRAFISIEKAQQNNHKSPEGIHVANKNKVKTLRGFGG